MTCAFVLLTTWGGDGPSIENNKEWLCDIDRFIILTYLVIQNKTTQEFLLFDFTSPSCSDVIFFL